MASRSAGPRATTACRPNAANSWTLGRGPYGGSSADSIGGYLDEVRISDVALAPSQFLNVIPSPRSMWRLPASRVWLWRGDIVAGPAAEARPNDPGCSTVGFGLRRFMQRSFFIGRDLEEKSG